MSNPKIWLSTPHMGGSESKYVTEAFDTNWVAPIGPNINGFEEALEGYHQEETHIATLSSGTAAIHLALIQCGVGKDDEVLCQTFTFCGSVNPVLYQGATPILIDSEPETWNICPIHLEAAIKDRISLGKKPKAIITVHLFGMPYNIEAVHKVASIYDIPVIEDSAEALGSMYKGQKCGTFGRFGILSFNGNKIITTSGGGAMVCHSKEDKAHTVFLATQARDDAPHYEHTTVGYNYRMSNISAGIGRGQMEVLPLRISQRREMHNFYLNIFSAIEGVTVFTEPSEAYYSNHWLSAITIDPAVTGGVTREDLRHAFAKANIESRPLWKPMHLQPLFKNAPYYGGSVAETLFDIGLCLPSGSNLTDIDRNRIENVIFSVFN